MWYKLLLYWFVGIKARWAHFTVFIDILSSPFGGPFSDTCQIFFFFCKMTSSRLSIGSRISKSITQDRNRIGLWFEISFRSYLPFRWRIFWICTRRRRASLIGDTISRNLCVACNSSEIKCFIGKLFIFNLLWINNICHLYLRVLID